MGRKGTTICCILLILLPTLFIPAVQAATPEANTLQATAVTATSATMNGEIISTGGEGTVSVWFELFYDGTIINTTDIVEATAGQSVSVSNTSLLPGSLYSYRIVANNSEATVNGSEKAFLTKPVQPSTVQIEENTTDPDVAATMTWEKGTGSNKTIVLYSVVGPETVGSGETLYFGAEEEINIMQEDLQLGETHYFGLVSYKNTTFGGEIFEEISAGIEKSSWSYSVTTLKPSYSMVSVLEKNETSIHIQAHLNIGNESCTQWCNYTDGITEETTTTQILHENTLVNTELTGLSPGTAYNVTYYASNSMGVGNSTTITTLTHPEPPENFEVESYSDTAIELSWDLGSDDVILVRQAGNYPDDPGDGTIIYEGSGTTYSDTTFSSYASQYYRIWSKSEAYNITEYSMTYESGATLDASFEILFPQYLELGQYVMAWGMIRDVNGEPITGYIANTTIRDNEDNILVGPVPWNCSSGNYQTAIATSSLSPGEYEIVVEYTNETGVSFTHRNTLYLAIDPTGPSIYVDAWVYYTFYDISTSTGLDDNYYKVYISHDTNFSEGDRVKGGKIGVIRSTGESITTNKEYYVQIKDFNNNILPFGEYDEKYVDVHDSAGISNAYASFQVTATEFYIDLGVYLNQMRIKNMNASTVYIVLRRTDGNAGQVVGRFIPPWEETEVFVPDGMYNLSVHYYNNQDPEYGPTKKIYPWDEGGSRESKQITTDTFYWIQGYNLEDVINVVEEEGTWLYYTIFDMNTGSKLEDDFYKVYISEDTTFNSDDRCIGGRFKTSIGEELHFKVVDYWGNTIYPTNASYENLTIIHTKTFLDIGIPLNQYLIKNVNASLIYFRLTNGNLSDPVNNTWYNRWIPPHESKEIFLRSGLYNISIEYYYPYNGEFIKFENRSNVTINQDIFHVIRGKNALAYFNFYNQDTGLGLPDEVLKVYVDGVRIPFNHIETEMGKNISLVIKDFYNFELYNDTKNIKDPLTYIDLGLPFHSYKFTNDREEFFVVGLQKEGASKYWGKAVGPYETIEFIVPGGNYTINISYYNDSAISYATFDEVVNSTKAFAITGRNFSVRVDTIIEGQQQVVTTLENQTESFNYTNSLLFETLELYYYSNETVRSILNTFREPHVWQVPTVNYTFADNKPPITTIYGMVSLEGEIKIRWHATDDISGVSNVSLYYRITNSTAWKPWKDNESASGEALFNGTVEELIEGEVYWFKAIARDNEGNVEREKDTNVINVTYETVDIGQQADAAELIKSALSNNIFILIIILIVALVAIVIIAERRKEKAVEREEGRERQAYPSRNYGAYDTSYGYGTGTYPVQDSMFDDNYDSFEG